MTHTKHTARAIDPDAEVIQEECNMERRFTERQLADTLAAFDRQIAGMDAVLECYERLLSPSYPKLVGNTWKVVMDAWNAAHEARETLYHVRTDIALNPYRSVEADLS